MNKYHNIAVSPEAAQLLKVQAAKERTSIKALVERLISEYLQGNHQ